VPLTQLARREGIALRTAQRRVQQYRRAGLAGLARQSRTDRGQRRLPAALQSLIEGLALRTPPPTAAAIYRQVRRIAAEHGWDPPG
jgi:putative transposase